MTLHCIGSSSSGNSYLLNVNNEILILDAGVPIKAIKKSLGYDISNVVGCVVTHAHSDHSNAADDLRYMGIPVFEPYKDEEKRATVLYGKFRIIPFEVPHDGEPCVGFYIRHDDLRMIYATDFEFLPVHFKMVHLNAMLIECNHIDDLMSDDERKYAHSVLGHASLAVTKEIVRVNATDALQSVILCHLSDGWSDARRMVDEIREVVPEHARVLIADAGQTYDLTGGLRC